MALQISAYAAEDPEDSGEFGSTGDSFPVTLVVGDQSQVVMVTDSDTVSEILKGSGVQMGPHDLVSPSLNEAVTEFDEVVVTRREYVTYTEQYELPYETHYLYSPDVRAGTETVAVEGQSGLQVDTYAQYLVKGEVQEETLISQEIVSKPVHEEIHMGFKAKLISPLDFEWTFDDNGDPIDYTKVIRSGRATGYTASSGARTSTGHAPRVGYVAVNPRVIPYGSKLFIQSPDGTFIYGYAIAADTGGAMLNGRIDVDLYYDTYAESMLNGVKTVDIFVLE